MKPICLLLLAGAAFSLVGCSQDEYVYHDVYHHHTTSSAPGNTVAGGAQQLSDHNSPEEFHAQSAPQ
jgi:hypothetical protein